MGNILVVMFWWSNMWLVEGIERIPQKAAFSDDALKMLEGLVDPPFKLKDKF